MTTETVNPDNYTDLIREYTHLQAKIAPELARIEEIKKILKGLDYGSHEIAGCKVTIGRNARFNSKKFEEAYPVTQYPQYYKTAPDSAKVKDSLSPAELREYQTEGDPRVTIK